MIYQFHNDALTPDFQAHTLLNAIVNFTMIQELVGIPHAIGLYYTLTVELVFYTLCAVLFAVGLLSRSVRNAWVVLAGSVVLGTIAPLAIDHRAPMAGLFYVSSMFIGTVVYRYSIGLRAPRRRAAPRRRDHVVRRSSARCVNYVHFTDLNDSDPFTFWGATIAWSLAYLFFFGAFAMRHERFPSPFLWLGRISYSLYLMHPLIVVLVVHWTLRPARVRSSWWSRACCSPTRTLPLRRAAVPGARPPACRVAFAASASAPVPYARVLLRRSVLSGTARQWSALVGLEARGGQRALARSERR